jgi:hypothetical protein
MQEHRPTLSERRCFGPNVELAALKVHIANQRLMELVQTKAGAEAEKRRRPEELCQGLKRR